MNRPLVALAAAATICTALVPPAAQGAVTISPGANTVTTAVLELDFGDAGGNIERLDTLKWRPGGGALGPNLVAAGGPGPTCSPGEPLEAWGQAYGDSNLNPVLVAAGSSGTWEQRGTRTVEINSSYPQACFGDPSVTPVRTRYTFFDPISGHRNLVRVERRFGFSSSTPGYPNTLGLRSYVTRVPTTYDQVVHPNTAGTALVTDSPCPDGCLSTNWNGTWVALNNSATNAGVLVLRDPANTSPAKLVFDFDSFSSSNTSGPTLTKPSGGWQAPLTEAQTLCFYDDANWPTGTRSTTRLPDGCATHHVPIPTSLPTISGTPRDSSTLTASPGTWDHQSGTFTYQWSACNGGACTPIAGATAQNYTAAESDVGKRLRVTVTARGPDVVQERDSATSTETDPVQAIPPVNVTPPSITGTTAPGQELTADPGSWKGSPTSYDYLWYRCDGTGGSCSAIGGATTRSFTLSDADLGSRLRVHVVANNVAGPSAPLTSDPTATVAVGNVAPANLRPPTVRWTREEPIEGDALEAEDGGWSGSPTSFRYQWLRCDGFGNNCSEIIGATGRTYTLVAADVQHMIRVQVVAVGDGGTSPPVDSAPSALVRRAGALTARLRFVPNSACTGSPVLLDGTESFGPYPIVRYVFELFPPGDLHFLDPPTVASESRRRFGVYLIGEGLPHKVIADGPAVAVPYTFGWNGRQITDYTPETESERRELEQELANPTFRRLPVDITLTVQDTRGNLASVNQFLPFATASSKQRRPARCDPIPLETQVTLGVRRAMSTLRLSATAAITRVPCRSRLDCAGTLTVTGFSSGARATAAGSRRSTPLFGITHFTVQAGNEQTVRVALSRSARKTLRRRKRLRAKVTVTIVGQDGKTVRRSRSVTFQTPR